MLLLGGCEVPSSGGGMPLQCQPESKVLTLSNSANLFCSCFLHPLINVACLLLGFGRYLATLKYSSKTLCLADQIPREEEGQMF